MLEPTERDNLTRLVHSIRPDWDQRGILAALSKCQSFDKQDTIRAALAAAADPDVRTPGVIPKAGSHWDPPGRTQSTSTRIRRPPKREQECEQHPGEWQDSCRCCAADRISR